MERDPKTYVLHLTEEEFSALQEGARAHANCTSELERELKYARPRSAEDLEQFANDTLRAQYHAGVRSAADSLADEMRAGDFGTDTEDAREKLSERLHEEADGAGCVIYTGQAMRTLIYSDNDGAYADEFGSEGIVEGGEIQWSRLAFGAYHADLSELLWPDFENWKEEVEEKRGELEGVGLDPDSVELKRYVGKREVVDKWSARLEFSDGSFHSWTMSDNCKDANGVCMSAEFPAKGEDYRETDILLAPLAVVEKLAELYRDAEAELSKEEES